MVLPGNHLHAIFTLPEGDIRYSARWGWIKKEFTKAYPAAGARINISAGLALFNFHHRVKQAISPA